MCLIAISADDCQAITALFNHYAEHDFVEVGCLSQVGLKKGRLFDIVRMPEML